MSNTCVQDNVCFARKTTAHFSTMSTKQNTLGLVLFTCTKFSDLENKSFSAITIFDVIAQPLNENR